MAHCGRMQLKGHKLPLKFCKRKDPCGAVRKHSTEVVFKLNDRVGNELKFDEQKSFRSFFGKVTTMCKYYNSLEACSIFIETLRI